MGNVTEIAHDKKSNQSNAAAVHSYNNQYGFLDSLKPASSPNPISSHTCMSDLINPSCAVSHVKQKKSSPRTQKPHFRQGSTV